MSLQSQQHPYLYFSRAELPALHKAAKTGARARILNRICGWCDRFLDPEDEQFFDFLERKTALWKTRDICHTWQIAMNMLSFAYAFTGEAKYGLTARDALMHAIETQLADDPFDNSTWNRGYEGWRRSTIHQHDKGNYAWIVSNVYDLCYDLFSEPQRGAVRAHIVEGIHILSDPGLYADTMRHLTNNRGARAMIGVRGIYPLAIEGEVEMPQREAYLQEAIYAAETFLGSAFDQDGVSYEGPGYAAGSLPMVYAFGKMLARSGRPNLLRNPFWAKYLQHQAYELLPGGGDLNNLNDCDPPSGSIQPALFLLGSPAGRLLPWLAHQLDLHPSRLDEKIGAPIDILWVDLMFPTLLWEWCNDAPSPSPEQLGYPLSRCFPQRGIASMRTGWGPDDLLLSHKCGNEIHNLHTQSDQNHIALYALGERFLVDEGYNDQANTVAETAAGERNYRYYSRSDVHNTVLCDGIGQNGNMAHGGWPRYASGRMIDWYTNDSLDTSLGDASRAYGNDGVIDKALRRVMLVRDTPHPFVIVFDSIQVASDGLEHEFTALWRTARANDIETNGMRFKICGTKHDCHGHVLYPPSATLAVWDHYNLPQLRASVHAPTLEMVTAFAPVLRGEECPAFSCERNGEADYTIAVHDLEKRHWLRAGTGTTGALDAPVPVQYRSKIEKH